MRTFLISWITFSLLLITSVLHTQCLELAWSDEFAVNGAPNPANWGYDLGTGNSGWGNNEIQVYTNDAQNVRVENGLLVIEALKGPNGVWTSARVKSQGKKSFRYGKVQFRAKLPIGSGTWPALWMLGDDITSVGWPACGEIDVMEHVGKHPGYVHASLHSPSSFGGTVNTSERYLSDFATAFHNYEMVWEDDRITFMVDDQPYYVYSPSFQNAANWPFDSPSFFIMNIAMGGNWGSDDQYETGGLQNGIDPNLTQARMEVDFVRVYQEISTVAIEGQTSVLPFSNGLQYRVNDIQDATFNWTVPAGAIITAGQNSPVITVTWGDTSGEVSVEIIGDCGTYTDSLTVSTVVTPQGPSYILDDFEDGNHQRWSAQGGNNNTFVLTEQNGELQVEYDVSTPSQNPHLKLTLDQPVDLSEYSKMRVRVRTENTSGTINMRIDPFDINGALANQSPLFKLEPLIDNGEFAIYEFDFQGAWESSFPNFGSFVDSTQISGLNLYINYGFFGTPGSDVVWFDYIEMVNPAATSQSVEAKAAVGIDLYPNPARGTVSIKLEDGVGLLSGSGIELFDSQGKLWRTATRPDQRSTLLLDIGELPAGVYFMIMYTNQGKAVKKLVIQ